MDFVWVRWLDYDDENPGGWEEGRLDRVRYGKCRNDTELLDAYGFIDPRHIIRACHLIPDFGPGHVKNSVTLTCDDEEGDWKYHIVNCFVDRDMLMRYLGGGIGHFSHRSLTGLQTSYDMEDVESDNAETKQREYQDTFNKFDEGHIATEADQEMDPLSDWGDIEDDIEDEVAEDDEIAGSDDGIGDADDEEFDQAFYEL